MKYFEKIKFFKNSMKEFKKEEVNKIKAYSELYQKIVYILEIEKKVAEVLNDGQRRY